MSKLTSHVHVPDDQGGYTVFGPDDDLPEWAAKRIGAHAFEAGVHPFPDNDGDSVTDRQSGQEPPRGGPGSGKDAWFAFAHEKGVNDLPDDATRDQIIQILAEREIVAAQ